MTSIHDRAALGAMLLALALPAATALAEEPAQVGRVTAVKGRAVAERMGQPDRVLGCNDPIYAGDRVVTSDASRVGFLMDEVYTHVDADSSLRVAGSAAAPDLALERGSTRVIDTRDAGELGSLRVLDTHAQLMGNDVEGYVFVEKTGSYAMLCEWDTPLKVGRDGDESQLAGPGQCVISKGSEPMYLAPGHDARLGPIAAGECEPGLALGPIDPHLSPTDVAAGPMLGPWSSVPVALEMPGRDACDLSRCNAIFEQVHIPVFPPGGIPISGGNQLPGGNPIPGGG
jgi:hypothetical protein